MTAARLRVAARLLVIVVLLLPLAFVLAGSLRPVGVPPPSGLELLPPQPGLTAYDRLVEVVPLGRLVANSLAVVVVAVPVSTLLASWAGFALVQLAPRSRRLLVGLVTALLLVPLPMLWVPRFALFLELGLLGTLVPLAAPALAATTPFTVLLAYRAFRRVPTEQWEAARLEGAGALGTWWRVGLPQVRATTTAIAAVAFVFAWGNYLDALLYGQGPASDTLPLGIGRLATVDSAEQPVLFAGAAVLALPAVLALLAVQRPLLGDSPPGRRWGRRVRRPALALAVLLALPACGSGSTDAAARAGMGGRITVQAAGGEGEIAALQQVLDAFAASRPGTQVEFTGIPSQGDHVAKLATAIGFDPEIRTVAPFVWTAGGEVVDDTAAPTRMVLDRPEGRQALSFLERLQGHGVDATSRAAVEPADQFAQGDLAMFIDSRRAVPGFRGLPDLSFDVVPLPRAEAGTPSRSLLASDAWCVSKGAPALATELAQYAVGGQGGAVLARSGRTVPSLRPLAESPDFLAPDQEPRSSRVFLDVLPDLRRLPNVWQEDEAEEFANDLLAQYFAGAADLDATVAAIGERTASAYGT